MAGEIGIFARNGQKMVKIGSDPDISTLNLKSVPAFKIWRLIFLLLPIRKPVEKESNNNVMKIKIKTRK